MRTHAIVYDLGATEHPGTVAALVLGSTAVGQVSALPDDDGFLIRVWPPHGTHEYGGHNLTCASMIVKFTEDGIPIIVKVEAGSR